MSFAVRVRALREARGWSLAEVARRVGSRSVVKRLGELENGQTKRPTLVTAERLAKVFEVPLAELIDGIELAPAQTPRRRGVSRASRLPGEVAAQARSLIRLNRMTAEDRRREWAAQALRFCKGCQRMQDARAACPVCSNYHGRSVAVQW